MRLELACSEVYRVPWADGQDASGTPNLKGRRPVKELSGVCKQEETQALITSQAFELTQVQIS